MVELGFDHSCSLLNFPLVSSPTVMLVGYFLAWHTLRDVADIIDFPVKLLFRVY